MVTQVIREYSLGTHFKKDSRILVSSIGDTEMRQMEGFFKLMDFSEENVRFEIGKVSVGEDVDLIVIDDHSGNQIDQERMIYFLNNYPAKHAVIYTNNDRIGFLRDYRSRVNIANSEFTLYTRIMEILKFQHLSRN